MRVDSSKYKIIPKRVAWYSFVVLVSFLALILILLNNFESSDPVLLVRWILLFKAALFGIVALLVAWYGWVATRYGVFPPPGVWVIEGKKVYHGNKAKIYGLFLLMLSPLLVSGVLWLLYVSFKIL
jgi:hypothetical protein